jgi:hypothetical protein
MGAEARLPWLGKGEEKLAAARDSNAVHTLVPRC